MALAVMVAVGIAAVAVADARVGAGVAPWQLAQLPTAVIAPELPRRLCPLVVNRRAPPRQPLLPHLPALAMQLLCLRPLGAHLLILCHLLVLRVAPCCSAVQSSFQLG